MARPEKLSTYHRGRERENVKAVRFHLRTRNYVMAFHCLAYALQQSTAADSAASSEASAKFKATRVRSEDGKP